jgi:hypothetical protein
MKFLVIFSALMSTATFAQMMGPEMMVKKWSKFKAMESCYGQDIMKTYMLKMKRAIAKCTKTAMPELDLPLFSSPYRAVQALLNGARDMESVNVARFQNLMKNVQSGNVPGAAQSSYIPIPVPIKQQQQAADPVDEIMRKLFLRKIIDKFSEKDRDDDDDDDDFFNIEDGDFAELFFTKKSRGLPADAGLNRRTTTGRYKRQSDLYELGDRLSEKLMEQKEEMKMKMGNMTCVLKELKVVDENMELDLENMLDDVKSMNIRDKWLEDKTIEDIRTCYAVVQSLPPRFFQGMPLPEQYVKVKKFKKCKKMCTMHTCMNHDIKRKLEDNFGPLGKLVETTGLPENQLLPMAMKLLHGDMDMMDL